MYLWEYPSLPLLGEIFDFLECWVSYPFLAKKTWKFARSSQYVLGEQFSSNWEINSLEMDEEK